MAASQSGGDTSNGKGNGLLLYYYYHSFYSQKVIMALHEKRLSFKSEIVELWKGDHLQPKFLSLNPRGEVPVLQDGMRTIPDSARIIDYLEDNFSNGDVPRLIPLDQGPEVKQKVIHFREMLDTLPVQIITFGLSFHLEMCRNPKPPFKGMLLNMKATQLKKVDNLRERAMKETENKEALLSRMKEQEERTAVMVDKQEYCRVLDHLDSILDEVEKELASHTGEKENWWLCSDRFTTADITLAILLARLDNLGIAFRFWGEGRKPQLEGYFRRVQMRDSFVKTIPSTVTICCHMLSKNAPLVMGVLAAVVAIVGGLIYLRRCH